MQFNRMWAMFRILLITLLLFPLTLLAQTIDLDKKIIDSITDPIMHMIRNSIDHGIESAEERIHLGKPPDGFLEISALLRGGM